MDTQECLVKTSPLVLPIRGNPVTVDGLGQARGIAVSLGDPTQFFSMKPALNQNNTFVSNINQCDTGNYSCIAEHGGVYNVPGNVMRTNSLNAWNGSQGIDVDTGANVYFNDRMTLQGRTVYGLPFYTFQPGSSSSIVQTGLALGENSSFLQTAIDSAVIPNKAWSYWGGDQNTDEDGHVIIGGYDQKRVGSEFSTFDMTQGKRVRIQITSLVWTDGTGNSTSLLDNSAFSSLSASLEPFADYIEMPTDVAANFVQATAGTINTTAELIEYTSRPAGNLNVTLSTGLTVTIPSQILFDRGVSYDSQGNYNSQTYDFYVPNISPVDNYPEYTLFFGTPFLSQQYMIMDFDSEKFYLADAVMGAGSSVDVHALCTGGPNPVTAKSSKHVNVAAIAGGVGGGVGGLLIILLILFFFIRHRRRNKKETATEYPYIPPDVKHDNPPPSYPATFPAPVEKEAPTTTATAISGRESFTTQTLSEMPSPRPGSGPFSDIGPVSDMSRSSQVLSHHQQDVSSTIKIVEDY